MIRLLAISINPGISFIFDNSLSGISLGLMMFKGKNVALPKRFSFKNSIHSLLEASSSTTKKLEAPPSDVEMASSNIPSVSIKLPIVL